MNLHSLNVKPQVAVAIITTMGKEHLRSPIQWIIGRVEAEDDPFGRLLARACG